MGGQVAVEERKKRFFSACYIITSCSVHLIGCERTRILFRTCGVVCVGRKLLRSVRLTIKRWLAEPGWHLVHRPHRVLHWVRRSLWTNFIRYKCGGGATLDLGKKIIRLTRNFQTGSRLFLLCVRHGSCQPCIYFQCVSNALLERAVSVETQSRFFF